MEEEYKPRELTEAERIGKFLFIHHSHDNFKRKVGGIVYSEKDVIELLKLLGHPEPDWGWYKHDEQWINRREEAIKKREEE